MPSIIIAAHNEAAVIGRCLDGLTSRDGVPVCEITVVANGCNDSTSEVARRYPGVRVIDLATAGKAAALNAADAVTESFPRVYLDADIVLSPDDVDALCEALKEPVHAAVPGRRLNVDSRPVLIRAYYAVNVRLPAYQMGLYGRGAIAVSEAGRARFSGFPEMVADDLFLDSLFSDSEKCLVHSVVSTVEAPWRIGDLFRRLVRVRSGNAAMRRAAGQGQVPSEVRPRDNWAWLRSVVLPHPWLLPAGVVYATVTGAAAIAARRTKVGWAQDQSSRQAASGARG